jgi:hypothetical protein
MRLHDEDGSTIGGFWDDGSNDNHRGTVLFSDNNPGAIVEPRCKSHADTRSIMCRNYSPKTVETHIPPPCEGCDAPKFVVVHKYGAAGMERANPDEAAPSLAVESRRSYWTMGAYEEGCSCSDHFMGGSFPAEAEPSLTYDVDLPVEDHLNSPGEYEPEFMPPNSRFVYHSNDPAECLLLRMRMRGTKPVHLFFNGKSMDHRKLSDGTKPSASSAAGTNLLDPQHSSFHLAMCGDPGGQASYVVRVREAVQVTMEIEMTFAEFFAEAPQETAGDTGFKDESLYQRTSGLDRMVNNFATLLEIPSSKIKVVCVHPVGQPCIPNELEALLGGYNPSDGRRDRRRSASASTLQVEMEVVPPNPVNDTGSSAKYEENLAFFNEAQASIERVTSTDTFAADFADMTGLPQVKGVAVTNDFGPAATAPQTPTVIVGDVRFDATTETTAAASKSTVTRTSTAAAADATTQGTLNAGAGKAEGSNDGDAAVVVGASLAVVCVAVALVAAVLMRRKHRRNASAKIDPPLPLSLPPPSSSAPSQRPVFDTPSAVAPASKAAPQRDSLIDDFGSGLDPVAPTSHAAPTVCLQRGLVMDDFAEGAALSGVITKSPCRAIAVGGEAQPVVTECQMAVTMRRGSASAMV